jgi:hypothetical protein
MAAAHLSLVEVVPGGIPLRDRRGSAPAPRYRSSAAMAVAMWVALAGRRQRLGLCTPSCTAVLASVWVAGRQRLGLCTPSCTAVLAWMWVALRGPDGNGIRLCTPSCTAVLAWMWVALRGPAPGARRHTQRVPDPREGLCPFEPQKRGQHKCSARCHASGVPNAGIDPNCSRTAVTAAIQLTRMQQAEARSLIRPINPATHCRRKPTENHIVFRDRPPSRREASHRAGLVP